MNFEEEQDVRTRAGNVALAWFEEKYGPFQGSDPQAYRDLVVAAHLASEESRLALHRWIDAGRRAGFSWTEIGTLIGTSKQAAQQRFGGGESRTPVEGEGIIVRTGATALNEMAMLREEGAAGRELIGTAALQLFLRQTDRRWEHVRVAGLVPDNVRREMEGKGWTWVSSWYPFQYFKREAGPLG